MNTTGACFSLSVFLMLALPLVAEVRPNALFSNGAVLQQEVEIPVWGTAAEGEKITVEFEGQAVSTTAKDGKWLVRLKPHAAGGPFKLMIQGTNAVTIEDVLVGEVWVCSGQSNMASKLREPQNANDPQIRFFTVGKKPSALPTDELVGKWEVCTPETAAEFSAVGYYFGRDLRKATNRPVGLIHSSWGGTQAESWISLAALEQDPAFKKDAQSARALADAYPQSVVNYPNTFAEFEKNLARWNETDGKAFEEATKTWKELNQQVVAEGKPAIDRPVPASPKPKPPIPPNGNQGNRTVLFNGMINPLIPYAIRGVIWYQGESNSVRAKEYRKLFSSMIADWRKHWGQGDFPFLFVQIAPHKVLSPELREAQLQTWQTTPNTAMAVITDAGDAEDLHPRKKEPVGVRLALAARARAYGENIEYSGPVYESQKIEGNRVVLRFSHLGGGLVAKDGPLKGFTVAGADQKFVEAIAQIDKDTVVVSSETVATPVAVRYGWSNVPDVNLFNEEGLPATPFRTDAPEAN